MKRFLSLAVGAVALVFASAVSAQTVATVPDYCLSMPDIHTTLVGKGFGALPSKRGSCKLWLGYSPTVAGEGGASIGSACLTSDGTRVKFIIHSAYDFTTITDAVELNVATATGTDEQTGTEPPEGTVGDPDLGGYIAGASASGGRCSGNTLN